MLEYTNKYWKVIIPLVKKSLTKRYGKEYGVNLIDKVDKVYKELLNRAPDIGKDNPMASNMYECLIVFAIYSAADGKISKDELRDIVNEIVSTPIIKVA